MLSFALHSRTRRCGSQEEIVKDEIEGVNAKTSEWYETKYIISNKLRAHRSRRLRCCHRRIHGKYKSSTPDVHIFAELTMIAFPICGSSICLFARATFFCICYDDGGWSTWCCLLSLHLFFNIFFFQIIVCLIVLVWTRATCHHMPWKLYLATLSLICDLDFTAFALFFFFDIWVRSFWVRNLKNGKCWFC